MSGSSELKIWGVISKYKEPIIVLLCFVVLHAISFASGYFLNPMPGPPISLPFGLLLLFYTLSPVFSLAKKKNWNAQAIGQRFKIILAIVLIWVVLLGLRTLIPNGFDGVALKLSQFSEQEFQEISDLVDAAHEKHRNDPEDLFIDSDNRKDFLKELKNRHEFFNLSSFPINVEKQEDSITIDWSSGLAGGYTVVIFDSGNRPDWFEQFEAINLYDTVVVYYYD